MLKEQVMHLRRDAGISSITLIFWLMVLVIGTVAVIKVTPVYYEYWSLVSAVKSQAQNTDAMARSREVRESLMKRLDVADIREIEPDEIYIERDEQNNVKIEVKYTRKVKIIGNVSLSFDFDVHASGTQVAAN